MASLLARRLRFISFYPNISKIADQTAKPQSSQQSSAQGQYYSSFWYPNPIIYQTRKFGTKTPGGSSQRMALQLATTDICDAHSSLIAKGELRALHPIFQSFGRRKVFSGPVVAVKVFEDNVLIRELLEEKGDGRVLVVDGGGSLRCALMGGNLAQHAQNNGWAGVVINGCVRDVDEINGCDIGVRALASHPMKSSKKRTGEKHVAVSIAGVRICDGEWLYADTDGILISTTELSV